MTLFSATFFSTPENGIFLHPVPATWEHRSCAVLIGSLLYPGKTLQRENAQLPNIAKEKLLISPKVLYPAATKKEAKLIQFRTTFYSKSIPGNTQKHWSSVSGQHHLSFHEALRLLMLHTRSQFQCESHYVQTSLHLPLLQTSLFVHR